MNTTLELLDAVKVRHSLPSDYKLAKVMGVTHSCISNYRSGRSTLDDSMVLKVADLLESDPAMILATVHAERAKRPEEKAVWQSIMERLGGAAACALLGVALSAPAPAEAAPRAPEQPLWILCQTMQAPPRQRTPFFISLPLSTHSALTPRIDTFRGFTGGRRQLLTASIIQTTQIEIIQGRLQ